MASNRLELILSAKTKDANDALKQFDSTVNDTMGKIQSKAQQASLALGGLAIAGAAMTKSFISEANQMQKYEATLVALTGSTEDARVELEKYVKFAADAPAFDLKGVMDGALKMKALKVDVERFLPLAGDLAATFDQTLPHAALSLSKALIGSQDGIQQLQDTFGITKRELGEFGAALKSDGSIDTSQLEKLQVAIEKVASTKFGGVMMAQSKQASGAFASLEDAISRLKAAMGQEIIEGFAGAANALTGVVEKLEALPGPTKAMIAQSVMAVTALAGLGAAASGAVVAFGPLALAIGATGAAGALTTPITIAGTKAIIAQGAAAVVAAGRQVALTGAIAASVGPSVAATAAATGLGAAFRAAGAAMLASPVGVVVALGAAAAGLVHWYGKTVDEAEKLRKKSEEATEAFRSQRDAVLSAAAALREYNGNVVSAGEALAETMKEAGKTEVDANQAIIGLLDQLKQAQETGDSALEERILDRIRTLTRAREALAGTQAEKDAAAAKAAADEKAAIEAKIAAIEDYKKKASASYWETAKEELAALDAVLAQMDKSDKEYEALALSRIKLAREVGKEEEKAAEDARKAKIDIALHELDTLKAYGDKRLADQLAMLKQILAGEELNAEERKRLELEVISTQERLATQQAREREKREKDALRSKQELAKLEDQALQAQIKASDTTIRGLEEQLRQGKDVGGLLQEEIAARGELAEQLIKQQAALEKVGRTAAEQAAIEKRAQSELQALRSGQGQEADKAAKAAAESRKKSTLEALKLERELLEVKAGSDKQVTKHDLVAVAKQRLQLAEQQLQLEAELAGAGASEEEKQRIAIQLELDLWKTRKGSVTELAAATAELEKQKQKVEEMKGATLGGVQSLEEFVKEMNESFAGQKDKDASEPPQSDASGDTQAANQLGVDANQLGAGTNDQSAQNHMAELTKALQTMKPTIKVEIVAPAGGSQNDVRDWSWRSQQS
ncbi:MAG: hypothetical protein WC314_19905 [Vulcanimicrobiota bacterium]